MIDLIFLALIFVISITLHEFAHAWMSNRLGDPTPRLQGRLTPNPLKHIDPIGFALIFLIHFGRGRPVIVNPAYYKNPLRDELLVAMAGPATNLILACLADILLLSYAQIFGINALMPVNNLVIDFWSLFGYINVGLAVFNMLPIYPLDGYRIVKYLAPSVGYRMEQQRQAITMGLLILILLPMTGNGIGVIITTLSEWVFGIIHAILTTLFFF